VFAELPVGLFHVLSTSSLVEVLCGSRTDEWEFVH